MRITFKPTLLPTLAFIVILPILVKLGFWQLGRAEQKEAILSALAGSQTQTPYTLQEALVDPASKKFYGIQLTGEFSQNPDNTLLLMHMQHGQDQGYHVLTPFQAQESDTKVLINRGFIERTQLTNIVPPPSGIVSIRGIIDLPRPKQFILGENILKPHERPLEIQRVDTAELEPLFGERFAPLVVLSETDLQDNLIRDWHIVMMPPEKHLGYALQWFALAACLVVIYLVVNIHRST